MPPFFDPAASALATVPYPSPLGTLVLRFSGNRLAGLALPLAGVPPGGAMGVVNPPLLEATLRYLDAYFGGGNLPPRPPLAPSVSRFQARLRQALLAIPRGRTRRYGDLARELDSSPRAVGQACRANPVPIIVPCHRVVAVTGVGGFMGGQGTQLKRWLLRHEGIH